MSRSPAATARHPSSSSAEHSAGAPVYHGTHQHFDAFRLGRSGLVFFSDNRSYAAAYGSIIKTAVLRIERLADLDHDPLARAIAIANFNESSFRNVDDDADAEFNPDTDETWELTESPTFADAMRRAGYDGAVFSEGAGCGRAYAVFDVDQIRLIEAAPARETPYASAETGNQPSPSP